MQARAWDQGKVSLVEDERDESWELDSCWGSLSLVPTSPCLDSFFSPVHTYFFVSYSIRGRKTISHDCPVFIPLHLSLHAKVCERI